MNHCGTQKLETERLVLRRFTEDDALAMFENRASDSEVTKFLCGSLIPTSKSARALSRIG